MHGKFQLVFVGNNRLAHFRFEGTSYRSVVQLGILRQHITFLEVCVARETTKRGLINGAEFVVLDKQYDIERKTRKQCQSNNTQDFAELELELVKIDGSISKC